MTAYEDNFKACPDHELAEWEWHEPRSSEAECPMCKAHAIHDGRLHARDCSLAALIGAKVAE